MRLGRSLLDSGTRERGYHMPHWATGEDTRVVRKEDRSTEESLDYGLYWGFLGKARWGRINSLGLDSLINSSRLSAIR